MPILYIYNPQNNVVEKYNRTLLDPMPYVIGKTMTVGEVLGSSNSNILWTDKSMLDAWNAFRQGYGKSIFIGYAFKRIWEGGHSPQSQHYAGVALDIGQTLTQAERIVLWNYAISLGVWSYVEPLSITERWIHVDKRFGIPACPVGGFPMLIKGNRGVYVFILQDALTTLGFTSSGLDGIFGNGTVQAVSKFQSGSGIPMTGVVDCVTWDKLTTMTNGIGPTATTIK